MAPAIRPLYAEIPGKPPRHVGTCVLFRIGPNRFLLTAAHVIDEFLAHHMLLAGDGEMIPVGGIGRRAIHKDATTSERDIIDAGVLLFDEEVGTQLDNGFLTLADCDLRDWMSPCEQYVLYGYPSSKTRVIPASKAISGEPFRFLGPLVDDQRHAAFGVSRDTHVALDFDIKRCATDRGVATAPSPKGVSGGAIFSAPRLSDPFALREGKLTAILIAHSKRHKLLVGSRIFYHTELIRSAWPHIGASIPHFGGPQMRFGSRESNGPLPSF